MARYLVTGGAGFIGSHLATALLARGDEVRIVDNLSTGRRENLALAEGAEVIEGDICDRDVVARALDGIEVVFHEAAIPSVQRSVEDPIASNHSGIEGTLTLLVAARDAGIRRLIYASSSSVYGDSPTLPKREDMPPNPLSPYALTKLTGETYCRLFFDLYALETVSLRYFNVFGPRQDPKSIYSAVIPLFVTAALEGREATIYGDGEQTRDFTYIDNVVEANIKAAEAPAEAVAGGVFNAACGQAISVNDIVVLVGEILGRPLVATYGEARSGEVRHSVADSSRAAEAFGFAPAIDFKEGLARTIEAFRARR